MKSEGVRFIFSSKIPNIIWQVIWAELVKLSAGFSLYVTYTICVADWENQKTHFKDFELLVVSESITKAEYMYYASKIVNFPDILNFFNEFF